jgi:hypothetical protein
MRLSALLLICAVCLTASGCGGSAIKASDKTLADSGSSTTASHQVTPHSSKARAFDQRNAYTKLRHIASSYCTEVRIVRSARASKTILIDNMVGPLNRYYHRLATSYNWQVARLEGSTSLPKRAPTLLQMKHIAC